MYMFMFDLQNHLYSSSCMPLYPTGVYVFAMTILRLFFGIKKQYKAALTFASNIAFSPYHAR